MLALLPRGSALEKALLSIKVAAPPAFCSKMCTKPKITAPPSVSCTVRSVRRCPAITVIELSTCSKCRFSQKSREGRSRIRRVSHGWCSSVYSHLLSSSPLSCLPHQSALQDMAERADPPASNGRQRAQDIQALVQPH